MKVMIEFVFKAELLLQESVFLNRSLYQEAERHYSLRSHATGSAGAVHLEVNKIIGQIKGGANDSDSVLVADLVKRLQQVELENKTLRSHLEKMEARLAKLDGQKSEPAKPAAAAPAKKEDDDFDLFDEDEDDAEAQRLKEERVKAYSEKKAKSKKH